MAEQAGSTRPFGPAGSMAPAWLADVEGLLALFAESRPRTPSQAVIAAIVAEEAGCALPEATICAISERVLAALSDE